MEKYESVIGTRYKSPLLEKIWNQKNRIILMRTLWIELAKGQKQLGLDIITQEGINELIMNKDNIDIELINKYENKLKHDIMAHIHAYGDICPKAKSFIHLGATSCYITDNVDLIQIRDSLKILFIKMKTIEEEFVRNMEKYKCIPTIGYTHLQNAQLTSIGKRYALWSYDFHQDIYELKEILLKLPFRGVQGTIGTADSFMSLFDGDSNKIEELNNYLSDVFEFQEVIPISGQTYTRKWDVKVLTLLSNISQSIYKCCNDIRLLSSKEEVFESFGEHQVGSSAMAFKKNPINCEKICSLCRYIITQQSGIINTYINQWCERTLDDSAIRRIQLPEVFMLMEHILDEFNKVLKGLRYQEKYIERKVKEHMPYVMTERIIMEGCKQGGDRQELHERLRKIMIEYRNNILEGNEYYDPYDGKIEKEIIEKISRNPEDYIGNNKKQIEIWMRLIERNKLDIKE